MKYFPQVIISIILVAIFVPSGSETLTDEEKSVQEDNNFDASETTTSSPANQTETGNGNNGATPTGLKTDQKYEADSAGKGQIETSEANSMPVATHLANYPSARAKIPIADVKQTAATTTSSITTTPATTSIIITASTITTTRAFTTTATTDSTKTTSTTKSIMTSTTAATAATKTVATSLTTISGNTFERKLGVAAEPSEIKMASGSKEGNQKGAEKLKGPEFNEGTHLAQTLKTLI